MADAFAPNDELARLARQFRHEAIAVLVAAIWKADDFPTRVAAAKELLSRGYGRPPADMVVAELAANSQK